MLLKKFDHRNILNSYNENVGNNSKVKKWNNIQNGWKMFNERPCRETGANFTLVTGHDCLA